MDWLRKYHKEVVIGGLFLANLFVFLALWQKTPGDTLTVSFLNVGQGDAILIETPQKHQMLIDGGKNKKVISEIGKLLPFSDKTIDVVMATHPDADHIGGLPEVLNRYKVNLFIEPDVKGMSALNDELHERLEKKKVRQLIAQRGQVIDFGDGVKLLILFPNQDVSDWETNDASVVAKLIYGEHSFLFTGDATIKTENVLMNLNSDFLDSDVLKAGHHGSRTSTSLPFARVVSPQYSVISAGKNNSYRHPHEEVLSILSEIGAKILSTIDHGTVSFKTDGHTLFYR
jgi:competence protein ComEC